MARGEGARLGDYELVERIGGNGMAEVFRARPWQEAGRDVAIKIIRLGFGENNALRARFLREAPAVSRLSHPHILPLLDFGERDSILYLVMPLMRGGTLRDLLHTFQGPLPQAQAIPLFIQVCSAVHAAHTQGILHRNIKPSNIYVQQGRHVLLGDFGIVHPNSALHLAASDAGSDMTAYLAPEQMEGRADVRSDIYSLGMVLYQMSTGVAPSSGATPLQGMGHRRREPLPDPRTLNPNLPAYLVQALRTALAQDPAARFQSALSLGRAVQPQEPAAQPAEGPRLPARQPAAQSQSGPHPASWQADDQFQSTVHSSGWQEALPPISGPRASGWPADAHLQPEPRPPGWRSRPEGSFPPQADRLPPVRAAPSSSGLFASHAPPEQPSMPSGRASGPSPDVFGAADAYEPSPASSPFGNRPASGWYGSPSAPGALMGPTGDDERAGPPASANVGPFGPVGTRSPSSSGSSLSPGAPPYRPGFGAPSAAPTAKTHRPVFGPFASASGAPPRYGPMAPPYVPGSSPPGFQAWPEEPPQRSGKGLRVVSLSIILLLVLAGGGLLVADLNGKGPLSTLSGRPAANSQAPTATPSLPSGFQRYTNSAKTFSIAYPVSWQVSNSPASAGSGAAFQGPSQQILALDAGPGAGTPATFDHSLCQSNGTDSKPTAPTQVTIGGQQWTEEECNSSNEQGHIAVEAIRYKGHLYVIAYSSLKASFVSNRSRYFTPMEQTFTFLI